MDLPFSVPFYRWLLFEENSLGLSDLATVAPEVQYTLKRLQNIVRERDEIMGNSTLDQDTKNAKVQTQIRYSVFDSRRYNDDSSRQICLRFA